MGVVNTETVGRRAKGERRRRKGSHKPAAMTEVISENIKAFIRQRPIIASSSSDTLQDSKSSSGIKEVAADGKSCSYFSSTNKLTQKIHVDRFFQPRCSQEEVMLLLRADMKRS